MLVSILIPCYNADRWISQAIESALAQTWVDKEIVVVDDGSTDRSLSIIRGFDGCIRWETGRNHGGNVARNRLLELARGDWIQYLDADDWLLPHKIASQIEFLMAHPYTDILFGPITLEWWSERKTKRELLPIPEPHDPWELLASWRLPQTGAPLWRKEALLEVGGWKDGQPCCQEHELYLRLIKAGKRFVYCPAGGAVYRQWSEDTVCRKDVADVHRRRLEIEKAAEDHLRKSQQLTVQRLQAISQARFEIARGAWLYDPAFACQIVQQIFESDPQFSPIGSAAPFAYRFAFRWLGFHSAENLAANKRKAASSIWSSLRCIAVRSLQ
jgi:hypothetical protein